MILSSSIAKLTSAFGVETAIEMMSKAGFDGMDFMFGHKYCNPDTDSDEFKTHFLKMRALAEDKGIPFVQAHAYGPSSHADPERNQMLRDCIIRSIRNASYLGIPKVVVHPVQHLKYFEIGVPEQLFEMNVEFYNSLKPYCEEYNIQVAVENMWQYRGRKIVHSTCSRPEEFNRYLDALDSRWFIGCLDIGHAFLVCEDIDTFIEKMGADRLKCLHLHDVDGIIDNHTLPYYGAIEWNRVMKALAKIGYRGELNYEAGGFLASLPTDLYQTGIQYMADIGRYLIKKFDEYSAEFAQNK